ncbi:cytochrome P450 [Tricladium varicosporioides]|nr:cytochrome P450 [Hymenoscyphus varicosporioides]
MFSLEVFTLSQRLGLASVLLLLYPLFRLIYNVTFHPLARVPGPRTWAASRIPFIKSFVTGMLVHDIEKLHRKYGPVIRIAPNEVTFIDPEAWQDIFQGRPGHAPFQVDQTWWASPPGQSESLASAGTEEKHARMRRTLDKGFTQRALRLQEPMIQEYAARLIGRLQDQTLDRAKGFQVDIVPWFNYFTFDLFGDLAFGESFNCLENSEYHPWVALIFNNVKALTWIISARFYPAINYILLKSIPPSIKKLQTDHFDLVVDKVQRRMNLEVSRPDLMEYVMKGNEKYQSMTRDELDSTFSILVNAGSETIATVMSGTLNHLMASPEMLHTLVQEVRSSFSTETEITLDALKSLPYLNAAINEGLRICPPIPIMLPRLVPKEGDSVCGIWLPGGTSVSFQVRTLFRNPEYFYESSTFLPERWLPEARNPDSPFYNDRADVFLPFGLGSRSCIGRELAWSEMRLVLARLLWRFDVQSVGEPLKWDELRTFLITEKRPIMVSLMERGDL